MIAVTAQMRLQDEMFLAQMKNEPVLRCPAPITVVHCS